MALVLTAPARKAAAGLFLVLGKQKKTPVIVTERFLS